MKPPEDEYYYHGPTCSRCRKAFTPHNAAQQFCTDCQLRIRLEHALYPEVVRRNFELQIAERQHKLASHGHPRCQRCGIYYMRQHAVQRRNHAAIWWGEERRERYDVSFNYCNACYAVYKETLRPLLTAYRPCKRCIRSLFSAFSNDPNSPSTSAVSEQLQKCRRDQKLYALLARPEEIVRISFQSYGSETERRLHLLVLTLIPNGKRGVVYEFENGHRKRPDFLLEGSKQVVEVYGELWHGVRRNHYYGPTQWDEDVDPSLLIECYADIGIRCHVVWARDVWKKPAVVQSQVLEFIGCP